MTTENLLSNLRLPFTFRDVVSYYFPGIIFFLLGYIFHEKYTSIFFQINTDPAWLKFVLLIVTPYVVSKLFGYLIRFIYDVFEAVFKSAPESFSKKLSHYVFADVKTIFDAEEERQNVNFVDMLLFIDKHRALEELNERMSAGTDFLTCLSGVFLASAIMFNWYFVFPFMFTFFLVKIYRDRYASFTSDVSRTIARKRHFEDQKDRP